MTCRFYEPSPLWRKGWCRNPLLYDAQTNHLVEAESLSCSRTFIDYWEARDSVRAKPGDAPAAARPVGRAPATPLTPTGPGGAPLRSNTVTVAEVQAAKQPQARDRPHQLSIVKPEPVEVPVVAPMDTVPLATVMGPEPAVEAADPTVPAMVPIAGQEGVPGASGGGSRIRVLIGGILLVALVAAGVFYLKYKPVQPPTAVATLPTATRFAFVPTATAPPRPTAAPTAVPVAAPLVMALGAHVQATGLNGGSLNVRQNPGLKTRVVGQLANGVTAQLQAGPQTVDGVTWWQISGWDKVGTLGWASAKFLNPVR
ncbi:MAG: hypothetical protein ACR2M0_04445 [Chloroflexia bacterium]